MSACALSPVGETQFGGTAIAACQRAVAPSRTLDSQIALAVFPALRELSVVEEGIWTDADGTRARAWLFGFSNGRHHACPAGVLNRAGRARSHSRRSPWRMGRHP